MTRTATILREYGPFPGVEAVRGAGYDGKNVWLASGDRLNALDPVQYRDRQQSSGAATSSSFASPISNLGTLRLRQPHEALAAWLKRLVSCHLTAARKAASSDFRPLPASQDLKVRRSGLISRMTFRST